ncbi:hypothetical protein AB1Y20_003647 [Prymnesium parvum]|uniref:HEAT repeat-containing protein 1 n=1 Tax=Prymnesium parvum TaxID=97485 RepID=A0AB34J773_PRYPA
MPRRPGWLLLLVLLCVDKAALHQEERSNGAFDEASPTPQCDERCQPHCVHPCDELNGDVELECGGCATDGQFGCHPLAAGYESWRPLDRQPPSTFDAAHGCRRHESEGTACLEDGARGADGEDSAGLRADRSICARAQCVFGPALRESGVDVRDVAATPTGHLMHEHLPVRLAAAEITFALCAQLAGSHSLEGPECLAICARQTESHDFAVRWVGVDTMERLVRHRTSHDIGGMRGGGAFNRSNSLQEMAARLSHPQRGTRWMAVYAIGRLARDEPNRHVMDGLVSALADDDMGFPPIGFAACEALGRAYLRGTQLKQVISSLAAMLEPQPTRRSSRPLLRLLTIDAISRVCVEEACALFGGLVEPKLASAEEGVRAAALVALGVMQARGSAETIWSMRLDASPLVRCAASQALARLGDAVARSRISDAAAECEAEWRGHMHDAATAAESEVQSTLELLAVAPPSEEAADLCVLYLTTRGDDQVCLRWQALLTLRLVAAAEGAASAQLCDRIAAAGVELTTRAGASLFDRYAGMKLLELCASSEREEVHTAYTRLLNDEVDVIRLQAGDSLVDAASASHAAYATIAPLLLGTLASPDVATRFAAAAAVRKLAWRRCSALLARAVHAALFGGLHSLPAAGTAERMREELRRLLQQCGEIADTSGEEECEAEDAEGSREELGVAVDGFSVAHLSGGTSGAAAEEEGGAQELVPGETARDIQRVAGVLDRFAHLRGRHCLARMRTLPDAVRREAFEQFRKKKSCFLTSEPETRARGVLLMKYILREAELAEVDAHFQRVRDKDPAIAHSIREWKFFGRITLRGGLESPVEMRKHTPAFYEALSGALARLDGRGLLPAVWRRSGAEWRPPSAAARLYGTEFVQIDKARQELACAHDVKDGGWASCACKWHVDGGDRGYKMWGLLHKAEEIDPQALDRAGLDPAAHPSDHSNLVVAPLDNVQALCGLAMELNASFTGDRSADVLRLPRRRKKVAANVVDAGGSAVEKEIELLDLVALQLDYQALEAASCVVHSERGDITVLFPDVFHRTQNMAVDRVAFISEAF